MRNRTFKAGLACLGFLLAALSGFPEGVPAGSTASTVSAVSNAVAPAVQAMGLKEVRSAALGLSAAVRKTGLAVDQALLVEKGQGYAMLPSPSTQAGASLSLGSSSSLSLSLGASVQQKIYDGGKSALSLAIDSLATESARLQARAAVLAVLEAADDAYYAVLQADASIVAAKADLDAATTALALAQGLLDSGQATKADVLKAKSEQAAKASSLAQAQSSRKAAMAKLASLSGLDANATLAPADFQSVASLMTRVGAMDESEAETLVSHILSSAAEKDPDLAAAAISVKKADLELSLAKAAMLPTVSAGLSASLAARQAFTTGATPSLSPSGSVSISASMPLDLWNSRLEVEKAGLSARSPAIDAAETKRSLELSVRTAVYAWISQAQAAESSRVALDYAQANYENSLELYRLQTATQTELSAAQTLVSSARRQYDNARYSFLGSVTTLRTLAGLDDDELLKGMVP